MNVPRCKKCGTQLSASNGQPVFVAFDQTEPDGPVVATISVDLGDLGRRFYVHCSCPDGAEPDYGDNDDVILALSELLHAVSDQVGPEVSVTLEDPK